MSPSTLLQPHTAILEIARRLLKASSICICSVDAKDEHVTIAHSGATVPMTMNTCIKEAHTCRDGVSLIKNETGYELGIALDEGLILLALIPADISETELRTLTPNLSICAKTILANWARQNRRPDLPDRTLCAARIQSLIAAATSEIRKTNFSVIEFVLDHLDALNLRHGWETSNLVVDKAISRVQAILPPEAFLCYAGGGTIVIVSPPATSLVTSRSLVTNIRQALAHPIAVNDHEIHPTFSIGWALFPDDGSTADSLLQAADAAIADVRRHGGAHDRRAASASLAVLLDTSSLERDLAHAVAKGDFTLNWMPIIAPGSQTVVALEALMRWERSGYGKIPPEMFIHCAETIGLIEKLDQWSLQTACRAAVKWSHPLRVCVNISPTWLAKRHLSGMVESTLEEIGLPPERLQIELSEKRSFGPRDIAYQELSRLRALGVHVALDDFGAGHSSLERLANLPVDQIKFDRSFMLRLNDDRRVNEVLGQTIQMARRLGISCCAKGVETERQMAFLDSYGCEEVQGYLLGIPTPDYL